MYDLGWRRDIFIVDDNIAGNRRRLKQDLLPALIDWLKEHNYPFNIIFADACHGKPEALKWLMNHHLEGFIGVTEKIRYFRENQYFDIHKPPF